MFGVNSEYRAATGTSDSTALRELRQLTRLGVVEKVGGTGRATYYSVTLRKPVTNPVKPFTRGSRAQNPDERDGKGA
jgi:hypothetical protein